MPILPESKDVKFGPVADYLTQTQLDAVEKLLAISNPIITHPSRAI